MAFQKNELAAVEKSLLFKNVPTYMPPWWLMFIDAL
jgi:hypothetical protein